MARRPDAVQRKELLALQSGGEVELLLGSSSDKVSKQELTEVYLRQLEGRQRFTHRQLAKERMPELEERADVLRVSVSSWSYLTSSAEMAR
eukprot:463767-Amphidinium_carterae.1